MAVDLKRRDDEAAIVDIKDFDKNSGVLLERIIFNYRKLLMVICGVVTVVLGWHAVQLNVNASFERMMPTSHPFIRNYNDNIRALRTLGNQVRIVVENTQGNIYDKDYLETLRKVSDTVFLMKGTDRSYMRSLWTTTVRWTDANEQGLTGSAVMPDDYNGSQKSIDELRVNVTRAALVGNLVSNDLHSSMVVVPVLDVDPITRQPLDYGAYSNQLESRIRALQTPTTHIYIIGFAKLVGDLIAGLWQILSYFGFAALIALVIIYSFTRCVRSTIAILTCSCIAVTWQLGILDWMGYDLDPYSILVPFLIFAIGVSHGAQKMNGIMQDVGRGTHRYIAARLTFRRLFVAGFSALVADAVGFAVLSVIDIPVIHDLALTASIGVTLLIFTNLVLLPVTLSYIGVGKAAAERSLKQGQAFHGNTNAARVVRFLVGFTGRKRAIGVIMLGMVLAVFGVVVGSHLKIGDLDPGAPELRESSRYNTDNAFITSHFFLSSDQFAVIVKAYVNSGIAKYPTMIEMDRLEQTLRELPGVQTTVSEATGIRQVTSLLFEGSPKWWNINRDHFVIDTSVTRVQNADNELGDTQLTIAPIIIYLFDHKADTLTSVVDTVQAFAAAHDTPKVHFLLAAGSAGIEAATNIVVAQANQRMLFLVYGAVVILCLISFRSWRAALVAIIPLALTSVLCQALMVILGIGVKVATLPVIALGVGIGVDYALYLLSIQLACQRSGMPLAQAYRTAVQFTGKIVALVGVTLTAGVILWAASPIKFQADMGILLAFMFLWNMIGALILIPALSHFFLQGIGANVREHPSEQDSETLALMQGAAGDLDDEDGYNAAAGVSDHRDKALP